MKKINIALSVLSLIYFLSSCIKNVDKMNYSDPAPVELAIISVISPEQEQIIVQVIKSRPFFNNSNFTELVKNATVTLSDKNNSIQLNYYPNALRNGTIDPRKSCYAIDSSNFKIRPGTTYYLSVSTPEGLTATAHCTVPSSISVDAFKRSDPVYYDSTTTLFPFSVTWDIMSNKIVGSFTARTLEKATNDNGDTSSYSIYRQLGFFIHPEQQGNTTTAIFSDYLKSSKRFMFRKITSIDLKIYEENMYQAFFYNYASTNASYVNPDGNKFNFNDLNIYQNSEIALPKTNIKPGSVTVMVGSNVLQEGVDYTIDYKLGLIRIINAGVIASGQEITYKIESNDQTITVTDPATFTNSDSTSIPFEDNLFSEPTNYFSNIEGGVGVFGAYNISTFVIP